MLRADTHHGGKILMLASESPPQAKRNQSAIKVQVNGCKQAVVFKYGQNVQNVSGVTVMSVAHFFVVFRNRLIDSACPSGYLRCVNNFFTLKNRKDETEKFPEAQRYY
ncbi:hypothetical protein A9P82_05730 [Arachidicoccus ginsenosidimutans]|uniref:hypothetical protein n=1 Tax=Arachidicoccus sp. BS20 TaxID=1850526 RepID=UPI0007F0D0C7|nr:hypothetical protein [Arachidicoccus sp. BS20]ANI88831.1 hypothetical protein A9P82_05730 [Arachidicoccus sp. BS20]